jgi:hypothetical protein
LSESSASSAITAFLTTRPNFNAGTAEHAEKDLRNPSASSAMSAFNPDAATTFQRRDRWERGKGFSGILSDLGV